jgi:MFS family permease
MTSGGGTFLSALRHREVRVALAVHSLGSAALGVSGVVISVALFTRTGSSLWASIGVATRVLPYVVLSPITGALSDRFDRVRVLRVTNMACLACSLVVAVLATRGSIVALAAIGLVLQACWTPAYPTVMALIPDVVDADDLAPATALVTTAETLAWVAGPGLGGLMCASFGLTWAELTAVGLGIVASLAALAMRRQPVSTTPMSVESNAHGAVAHGFAAMEPTCSFKESFVLGTTAVLKNRAVALPLVLVLASNFVMGASQVLMLVASAEWLGMGASGSGALNASIGAGGFLALLVVNRAARSRHIGAICAVSVLAVGLPYLIVGAIDVPAVALAVLALSGMATVLTEVLTLTTVQRSASSSQLASIFGILDSLTIGAMLLGTAVTSPLIEVAGIRGALLVIGTVVPAIGLAALPALGRRDANSVDLATVSAEISLLAGLSMLRTASQSAIEALAVSARREHHGAGTLIFSQGDVADDFFAVSSGSLEVFVTMDDGRVVGVNQLGPLAGFGELGVLRGAPRSASIRAITDVELLRISGIDLVKTLGPGQIYGGTGMAAAARNYVVAG